MLVGSVLGLQAQAQETQPTPQPDNPPGFWDRVKDGVRKGVDSATNDRPRGSPFGSAGFPESDGPLFEPVDPKTGGSFAGLFAHDDHHRAQRGQLAWPRAAVTFTQYGTRMPCWTARARIWTSASSSHDETFRICNAPIRDRDDIGQDSDLMVTAINRGLTRMSSVRVLTAPNTGYQRTQGPLPPGQPWTITIASNGGIANPLMGGVTTLVPRLGWVAGYVNLDELTTQSSSLLNPFQDPRMWFAGFDPNGNADRH
jgi:hypothetical protein